MPKNIYFTANHDNHKRVLAAEKIQHLAKAGQSGMKPEVTSGVRSVNFIIDFDSTFIRFESLDKLFEFALKQNPGSDRIVKKVAEITNKGMLGEIPFSVSLKKRIDLLSANKKDIIKLVSLLRKNITPSIKRNKDFFRKYKDRIYIISGGFKEYIHPVFKSFGIRKDHILANEFTFDKSGKITGFVKENPLTKSGGKVKVINALKLPGDIYVIGDGYSDYEIKKSGSATKFFVFCENVKRESVVANADYTLPNFDEFLYLLDLPRAYSYPKNRIKVLLTENIDKAASDIFKKEGYEVQIVSKAMDERELCEVIHDVSILGIRSKTKITEKVIASAGRLLSIGAFCIGTDQVNLKTSAKAGIAVFNAPFSNTRSVVELVTGEIIMLLRKTFEKSTKLHAGEWDKSVEKCYEVRGKTLGIIGYGNIGSQLSLIAESLGMNVCFYDIEDKLTLGNAKQKRSLKDLLRYSDVVTVHVDGRNENKNLISQREFSLMKEGSYFLNLSRGYVVDINALAQNLKSGHLAGAAVDVYPNEPLEKNQKFINILQGLPNVILTPHVGGNTLEAQTGIAGFVSGKIINFINTGDTKLSVNLPEVKLPVQKNSHRIIHIHKNIPGVLAEINGIYSEHRINILGQYLSTNEDVGIVVTDVNKNHNPDIVNHLRNAEATIKLRILY